MHALAGRLNAGPGILDGALSPPVISFASFFNISYYILLLFLVKLEAWRLELAALRFFLFFFFFFNFRLCRKRVAALPVFQAMTIILL
jgi:hypothetical protein